MPRTLKRLLPCLLLVLAAPSRAEDFKWNKDGNATLEQFVEYVTQKTGKNFIYDPAILKGRTITIQAPNLAPADLLSYFEAALETQNLGLAETGDGQAYKILTVDRLKSQPLPIYTQEDLKDLPRNDRLITQMITLKHVDPVKVTQVLSGLMHVPTGDVRPVPNSKLVTITEYASNMRRLVKIVEMMDQEAAQEVSVLSLQSILTGPHALKTEDVLTALEAGLELKQDESKPTLKFHPDSMLLFVKGSPSQIDLVKQAVSAIRAGDRMVMEPVITSSIKNQDPKPEPKPEKK